MTDEKFEIIEKAIDEKPVSDEHKKLQDRVRIELEGTLFPGNQTDESAVSHLAAERECSNNHALSGNLIDIAAGIFNGADAMLHVNTMAGLIVREQLGCRSTTRSCLIGLVQPGHLLSKRIMPQGGICCAPGS